MRIDKFLWFLRFASSRTHAHDWVLDGHMRLNNRRVERPSTSVKPGDVLVLPVARGVLVIAILVLPTRRGPASEAQECYRVLDETRLSPLAARPSDAADAVFSTKGDLQP